VQKEVENQIEDDLAEAQIQIETAENIQMPLIEIQNEKKHSLLYPNGKWDRGKSKKIDSFGLTPLSSIGGVFTIMKETHKNLVNNYGKINHMDWSEKFNNNKPSLTEIRDMLSLHTDSELTSIESRSEIETGNRAKVKAQQETERMIEIDQNEISSIKSSFFVKKDQINDDCLKLDSNASAKAKIAAELRESKRSKNMGSEFI